jgi:outer membrane protein
LLNPFSDRRMRQYSVLLALCLLALFAMPAPAQPLKIGHIDTLRIERESQRPQRGAENLKKEFAAREREVRILRDKIIAAQSELDKIGPTLPAGQLEKRQRAFAEQVQQFEQIRRNFVEDVDRRRAEERQKFFNDVRAVVLKIAEAQKYDLIVEQGIFASRAVDITDQVIKGLDAMK